MWDVKYRPLKFADVLGQAGSVQLLKTRLAKGTALDTSYIFAGGFGCGKTTLSRILARAILCADLNPTDPEPCNQCDNCTAILSETSNAFTEKDAASGGTIDHIRAIVEELPFAVIGAPKRVYLFDEAHRMSRDAQDVLLKPIEDKQFVGLFCTTELEKIRGPIRSRCETYLIKKVTRDDILARMRMVLDAEGVDYEDDAVCTVIDYAGGHVRDVLNRLEMIAQSGQVSIDSVREHLNLSAISLYYEILLAIDQPHEALKLVAQVCDQVAPEDVAAGLAEAAMNSFRMSNGMFADFTLADKALSEKVYAKYGPKVLHWAEYFLRTRMVSKVSLSCDVLQLSTGGSSLRSVPAPVVQAAPLTSVAQQAAPFVASSPNFSASEASPAPPAPPKPVAVEKTKLEPTKVGNLGSSDVQALTEHDTEVLVGKKPPRKRGQEAQPLSFTRTLVPSDDLQQMAPSEWALEFIRTWPTS